MAGVGAGPAVASETGTGVGAGKGLRSRCRGAGAGKGAVGAGKEAVRELENKRNMTWQELLSHISVNGGLELFECLAEGFIRDFFLPFGTKKLLCYAYFHLFTKYPKILNFLFIFLNQKIHKKNKKK